LKGAILPGVGVAVLSPLPRDDVPTAKRPDLTRGDLRRNARRARRRGVIRPTHAILGIDLASPTQAAVLADHESSALAKAMFSGPCSPAHVLRHGSLVGGG